MCLIIYAPKGVDKKKEFLKEAITKASEFNQDGMGYATKKANNVLFMSKGYFNLEEFLNAIDGEDLSEDDELLIHLRIGNIGNKDASLCHPFIVSKEADEILTIVKNNIDKPIVAHNGTMRKHVVTKSDYSDTYFFIKNVLSTDSVLNFLKQDAYTFDWLLQDHLSNSRLAIMFPDETETILLGEWHTYEGLSFSKDYFVEYFKPEITVNLNVARGLSYRSTDELFDDFDYENDYNTSRWDDRITSDINDSQKNKIYIPKLAYSRRTFRDWLSVRYIEYMGILIPCYDTVAKFLPVIDEENYDLFHIDVVNSNHQAGIWRANDYEVIKITNTGYIVREIDSKDMIALTFKEFYECFKFKTDTYTAGFYDDYYKLVSKLRVSKNLIKRLKKDLEKARNKNLDLMTVREIQNIEPDVLDMFILNAEIELDLIKNPHKLLF